MEGISMVIHKETLKKIFSKYLYEEFGIIAKIADIYELYAPDGTRLACKVVDYPDRFIFGKEKLKKIILRFLEKNITTKFEIESIDISVDLNDYAPNGGDLEGVEIWFKVDSFELGGDDSLVPYY